ncbi:hemerythrin domain-containing protein [Pseudonocardia halophobica]|uniref:Cation-binding protein n=1 Tax=Pseudonocardia halophobica TaxID=29401 RepID=A0A9W6P0X4_9PSEU|nr:hemerythrin domain-containing protein [Pseudonocardia halophobica]GLL15812.1 cation-binding protein [Pseudonocardia halophobica]
MPDITQLILDDHEWFRRRFAELDDLRAEGAEPTALRAVWRPLADLLDVHAEAEERIFYPQLLRKGENDPEEETLDAIGDHNDIRDGVREADRNPVGSAGWWAGVDSAREANDEHMGEEENEGLPDFRLHAPSGLRESLGRQFTEFKERHPGGRGIEITDKDPEEYVETIEREIHPPSDFSGDVSLGIGGLRGR